MHSFSKSPTISVPKSNQNCVSRFFFCNHSQNARTISLESFVFIPLSQRIYQTGLDELEGTLQRY